ncbi:general secretion pathway protein GspB [Vibrio sp. NH-UV-68]|uniref:general secretion pathway protein GspB n=1 Tax=unclassified Vibrio TaxID=2614977 RepID=UPI0036F432C0
MSKVMQALKESERLHQATQSNQWHYLQTSVKPGSHSIAKYFALALMPPIMICAVVVWQDYQLTKQQWLESNVAKTLVLDVPFDYHSQVAPSFEPLKATYREAQTGTVSVVDTSISNKSDVSSQKESVIGEVSSNQDPLLNGLDLSELSPELARRFESVLNPSVRSPSRSNLPAASNLAQQAERWYGKLPAMNFQTHVYSNNVSKRWVKVNGIEYNQGDWISDRVQLVAIEQQATLIRFNNEMIEVPALYDWPG